MSFRVCFQITVLLLIAFLNTNCAATHDELPQCGITGVFKTRQSVIQSPNYPDNYTPNTCWDYVIRSPYRCPTKFHIQFLDFHLESSNNCTNDYLAIGLENDGDDMDLLCGQVIGIKKYHTPDGVLRLRFYSDDSPWTTAKGFKLLITRLACEREDFLRNLDTNDDEDTEAINAPPAQLSAPQNDFAGIFQNLSFQNQHVPYPLHPLFGLNYPSQLPAPPPPNAGFGGFYYPSITQRPIQQPLPLQPPAHVVPQAEANRPCVPTQVGITHLPQQYYLRKNQGSQSQLPAPPPPLTADQYVSAQNPLPSANSAQTRQQIASPSLSPFLTTATEPCCASSFNQKRFYLSSPGFPRTAFTSLLPTQQRDCQFQLEKSAQNICRLRIEFKFYDFGQTYSGTGSKQGNIEVAIGTSRDVCTEDFLEIDGERFCGCRTGYVYNAFWGLGKKLLRMRIGYSGIPSSGFLLDIFQEECNAGQLTPTGNQNGVNYLQTGNFVGPTPVQPVNGFNSFGQQQQGALGFNNLQQSFVNTQTPIGLVQQHQNYPFYQQALPQPQYPQQFWMSPQPQQQLPMSYLMPQFRTARNLEFAKSESAHQPLSVVETNSTRKEYYYFDGDEAFARARLTDEPDDADKIVNTQLLASVRGRCSFDAMNVLRLSMDYFWLTKPTCYSPQGRWFSNLFG